MPYLCYTTSMAQKVNLPVISETTMSEIIYGMENQHEEFVFCIEDGNVYQSSTLADSFDDPDSMTFVSLPAWSSADGFKLMCSFAQSCQDSELKKRLTEILNSKQKGIFRHFRDTLNSKEGATESWYNFKDRRMATVIRTWYKGLMTSYQKSIHNAKEEESDDNEAGALMVSYDIEHLEKLDRQSQKMLDDLTSDNILLKKVLSAFTHKEAFCAYKDGKLCGQIVFEVENNTACVLIYYIEEKSRGLGLFKLLFDLMNRLLERRNVEKVSFPLLSNTPLADFFQNQDVAFTQPMALQEYKVSSWNDTVLSQEIAYLV